MRSTVAKLIHIATAGQIMEAFSTENVFDIQGKVNGSLGGLFMVLTFPNKEMRNEMLVGDWLKNWFSQGRPWNGEAASLSRSVWLNCMGVPLDTWCMNKFRRIGQVWGKSITVDENIYKSYCGEKGRMLIVKELETTIDTWMQVKVKEKTYQIKL